MKVYRLWTDSNHNRHYTMGYYFYKENAVRDSKKFFSGRSGADPDFGIEEIELLDIPQEESFAGPDFGIEEIELLDIPQEESLNERNDHV